MLIWSREPEADHAPADVAIGQPNFASEGRNGSAEPGPATLNVPTGIAAVDGILAVADAWNHRVLLWHSMPSAWNQPADVVVGQADFTATAANRGADVPRADTLNWCYGVAIHDGRLYVADTGNRRVLVWNEVPQRNGAAADLVLGQRDFVSREDALGSENPAAAMRWPHAMLVTRRQLLIADAGRSRVMGWQNMPQVDGQACDFVLGQPDRAASDHNRGEYDPSAASMNMPYGMCAASGQVVVADTANSRLLGFPSTAFATGELATRLAGQPSFESRGDNRWKPPSRDSLSWPYGISACGSTLVVADSGNNRVLLWDLA